MVSIVVLPRIRIRSGIFSMLGGKWIYDGKGLTCAQELTHLRTEGVIPCLIIFVSSAHTTLTHLYHPCSCSLAHTGTALVGVNAVKQF